MSDGWWSAVTPWEFWEIASCMTDGEVGKFAEFHSLYVKFPFCESLITAAYREWFQHLYAKYIFNLD